MTADYDRPLRTQIILGSTRQNRRGERVGAWVREVAEADPRLAVEFLDLRDFPLPFYDEVSGPLGLKGQYSSEVASRWVKTVERGEAYLMISPEYNHSFPAVLKNAIDYAYAEWNRKPLGLISYGGGAGGSRAVEQIRLVAVELHMAPLRDAVHIPMVSRAFDESGRLTDGSHTRGLQTVIDHLVWWGRALRAARDRPVSG